MIKIFFILTKKVTWQKNGCVGGWLLALPRAQMTRLSRILGVWFTYYVLVLINFMTPSKHLSIAYQGINLQCLPRYFFLSKASRFIKPSAYFWLKFLLQAPAVQKTNVFKIKTMENNSQLRSQRACLRRRRSTSAWAGCNAGYKERKS